MSDIHPPIPFNNFFLLSIIPIRNICPKGENHRSEFPSRVPRKQPELPHTLPPSSLLHVETPVNRNSSKHAVRHRLVYMLATNYQCGTEKSFRLSEVLFLLVFVSPRPR